MRTGDIIILNGTSSAGKTAIAGELQLLSDEPFLHSGIDHFLHNMPVRVFDDPHWCRMQFDAEGRLVRVTLGPNARAFICAMYRAIAEFARAGVSVIIDDVMYDREIVRCAAKTLVAFDPLLIGVRCRLDVALERERKRGDRVLGGALAFYESSHRFTEYDFEVDTSTIDARQAATTILGVRGKPRSAVYRLNQRFDNDRLR